MTKPVQNKSVKKHDFNSLAAKIQKVVAEHKLKPEVVDEAIEWARQQRKTITAKKIYEFPVLHAGWEMDDKGWVAIDDNGNKVIILTNHGAEYIASLDELQEAIKKYRAVIEATEKAIEMMRLK